MFEVGTPEFDWPEPLKPFRRKIEKIVCHHSGSDIGVEELHQSHIDRGGIGYNYFVYRSGELVRCRGLKVGSHIESGVWNERTLGVCFQGDLNREELTTQQLVSGSWLIGMLLRTERLDGLLDVVLHSDLESSPCPGSNFPVTNVKERSFWFGRHRYTKDDGEQVLRIVVGKESPSFMDQSRLNVRGTNKLDVRDSVLILRIATHPLYHEPAGRQPILFQTIISFVNQLLQVFRQRLQKPSQSG